MVLALHTLHVNLRGSVCSAHVLECMYMHMSTVHEPPSMQKFEAIQTTVNRKTNVQ